MHLKIQPFRVRLGASVSSRPHRDGVRHVITLRPVAAEVVADEPEFVGQAEGERAGPGAPGEAVVVVEVPAGARRTLQWGCRERPPWRSARTKPERHGGRSLQNPVRHSQSASHARRVQGSGGMWGDVFFGSRAPLIIVRCDCKFIATVARLSLFRS